MSILEHLPDACTVEQTIQIGDDLGNGVPASGLKTKLSHLAKENTQ